MSSQRHKRENNFFRTDYKGAQSGDLVGPRRPKDSSGEEAEDYNEVANWPDADRPTTVP